MHSLKAFLSFLPLERVAFLLKKIVKHALLSFKVQKKICRVENEEKRSIEKLRPFVFTLNTRPGFIRHTFKSAFLFEPENYALDALTFISWKLHF